MYGELDQPVSATVTVAVEPVPEVAYRSISDEVGTIGLSVGAKAALFVVAPAAEALSVDGAIAWPPYLRVSVSVEAFIVTELAAEPPFTLNAEACTRLLVSVVLNVTGFAYVPGIVLPSASLTVSVSAEGLPKAVPAVAGGTPAIVKLAGMPWSTIEIGLA